jgi:chromosomal replication initiation ATPase DnaA
MAGQSEELRIYAKMFSDAFPDGDYPPDFILKVEQPSLLEIIRTVCDFYGIPLRHVSARYSRKMASKFDVSWVRHVSAYLCRRLTTRSHREIMNALGGFDHTISRYAEKKIAAWIVKDERVADEVEILRMRIAEVVLKRVGSVECH